MSYLESLPRRVVTLYLPLVVFLFVLLFPFYWMGIDVVQAERRAAVARGQPVLGVEPTLAHFKKLLFNTPYPEWMWNTVIDLGGRRPSPRSPRASSPPTPSSGCASSGSKQIGLAIFLAYLVPPSILFIPLAAIVFKLGLFDTRWALILTYPTFLIPFCTWLLMGYFRSIPFELEECALIDGATRWQILVKIILPLAVPGLISAGIFAFTLSWNEFIYALTFVSSSEVKTVPVGVDHRAGRGRRLPLGRAHGGRAARLAAGRGPVFVLRRVLRLRHDRRGEGVSRSIRLQLKCARGASVFWVTGRASPRP